MIAAAVAAVQPVPIAVAVQPVLVSVPVLMVAAAVVAPRDEAAAGFELTAVAEVGDSEREREPRH